MRLYNFQPSRHRQNRTCQRRLQRLIQGRFFRAPSAARANLELDEARAGRRKENLATTVEPQPPLKPPDRVSRPPPPLPSKPPDRVSLTPPKPPGRGAVLPLSTVTPSPYHSHLSQDFLFGHITCNEYYVPYGLNYFVMKWDSGAEFLNPFVLHGTKPVTALLFDFYCAPEICDCGSKPVPPPKPPYLCFEGAHYTPSPPPIQRLSPLDLQQDCSEKLEPCILSVMRTEQILLGVSLADTHSLAYELSKSSDCSTNESEPLRENPIFVQILHPMVGLQVFLSVGQFLHTTRIPLSIPRDGVGILQAIASSLPAIVHTDVSKHTHHQLLNCGIINNSTILHVLSFPGVTVPHNSCKTSTLLTQFLNLFNIMLRDAASSMDSSTMHDIMVFHFIILLLLYWDKVTKNQSCGKYGIHKWEVGSLYFVYAKFVITCMHLEQHGSTFRGLDVLNTDPAMLLRIKPRKNFGFVEIFSQMIELRFPKILADVMTWTNRAAGCAIFPPRVLYKLRFGRGQWDPGGYLDSLTLIRSSQFKHWDPGENLFIILASSLQFKQWDPGKIFHALFSSTLRTRLL